MSVGLTARAEPQAIAWRPIMRSNLGKARLALSHTPITDAGLAQLKSLKNLTSLEVAYTHVTAEGVADLKSANPKVRVDF